MVTVHTMLALTAANFPAWEILVIFDVFTVLAQNPSCFCNDGMQFSRRAVSGSDGGKVGTPAVNFLPVRHRAMSILCVHDGRLE